MNTWKEWLMIFGVWFFFGIRKYGKLFGPIDLVCGIWSRIKMAFIKHHGALKK